MKKLQNPTTYFFKQAENPPDLYHNQIKDFVAKLLNKDKCPLCKHDYDSMFYIPRIMIHCGHSFCTPCLTKNRRVRCPMCLKLVKQLDSIERLPLNHTIFEHIVNKENAIAEKEGRTPHIRDAKVFLFGEFERVQREAHLHENPQKIDPDTGLPFCVFHPDRVQHFFCEGHRTSGCRVCIQIGHSRPDCNVIDLYNVRDPMQYLNPMQQRIGEARIQQGQFISNHAHARGAEAFFRLDQNQDDEGLVDDSDDQEQHKSI